MSQNMLVSMILRLVDEMSGPLKAAEGEVKHLQKVSEEAAYHSAKSNRFTAAEFRALTEGKKVAANNSQAAIERMSAAEFRASIAAKDHAGEAAKAERKHAQAVTETTSAYSGMASQILATAAAYDTMKLARKAFAAGADAMHTDVGMKAQGLNDADREAIHKRAAGLSGKFLLFNQTDIEKTLAAAVPTLGSVEHALHAADDFFAVKTIFKAKNGDDGEAAFNELMKGLETAGMTQTPERFHHEMDTIVKGLNAFPHTLSAQKFAQFYLYAGLAANKFNDEFKKGALNTILSEGSGSTFGQQLATLIGAIKIGRMSPDSARAFKEIGMVKPGFEKYSEHGAFIGIKPNGLFGTDVLESNPYKWAQDFVRGYAKRAGKTDPEIEDLLYREFHDRNAARVMNKNINQASQIEKDAGLTEAAPGLEAWKIWMTDATTSWTAVGEQFQNNLRDATNYMMPAIASLGNTAAELMAWHKSAVPDQGKTAELGAAGLVSLWAFLKSSSWVWGKLSGGGGAGAAAAAGAGEAAAVTASQKAIATAAASAGGASWVAGLARFAGPVGLAYGLYSSKNYPAAPGDQEDRQAALADMTKRWGVRPDLAPRAAPKVDTSEIDAAKDKASEAGEHIQSALNVTVKPNVDGSEISGINAELARTVALLAQIGAGIANAKAAGAALGASLGNLRKSPGALHDGPVTEGR